jgi:hypothetical protein
MVFGAFLNFADMDATVDESHQAAQDEIIM